MRGMYQNNFDVPILLFLLGTSFLGTVQPFAQIILPQKSATAISSHIHCPLLFAKSTTTSNHSDNDNVKEEGEGEEFEAEAWEVWKEAADHHELKFWRDEDHRIHRKSDIHEDTAAELKEEEEMAAWGAHDCNDAGMEAAAEERSLMMAQEMARTLHQNGLNKKAERWNILWDEDHDTDDEWIDESNFVQGASFLSRNKESKNTAWKDEDHLIRSASEIHQDTASELKDEEDLAAWDAHDCNDAGMEAAAEERALMLAQEIARKMREEAQKKRQETEQKKETNKE